MTRRLAVLFLLAMTGVLVAIGLVAARVGAYALGGYLVGATVLLGLMVRQARTTRRREKQDAKASGRTCTCCTTTVFDPVEIR